MSPAIGSSNGISDISEEHHRVTGQRPPNAGRKEPRRPCELAPPPQAPKITDKGTAALGQKPMLPAQTHWHVHSTKSLKTLCHRKIQNRVIFFFKIKN